jgi:hypothetical protein
MPLRLRFLAFAAPLLLVPVFPCAAPAVASRPATLLFRGTVSEPGGRPVRGARVGLEGQAASATVTDAEGRFALPCALPDVEALASGPALLVLRASHKGWNLALPTGESALALELRVVRDAGGQARLEIRSSDAALAGTVAAFARVPGDGTMAWRADFMRQLGAEDRSRPKLTALEVVPLLLPALAGGGAAAPQAVSPADSNAAPRTVAVAPSVAVAPPVVAAPAAPSAGAKPAPAVATPPAVPQPRPERPESLRLFPSAPEPGAAPPPAPETTTRPPVADSLRLQLAAKAKTVEGDRPPLARGPAGPRAVLDTAVTVRPGIRVSVRPDTAASATTGPAADAGGARALRVALGRALPDTEPPAATGRPCECQVKGTVEVSSDKPLSGTLRVAVWLADAPALRDTVALFMGPPRPFDLGRVPCGRHRLEVLPLSSRHFAVAPPALDAFDCRAGWSQQFRVVLEPR